MSLVLGDNFSYQANKPLDGRIKYNDVATMKAVADATMYDGCIAYCVATEKTYQWKSTNKVDETFGRWREFETGGGGGTSDYSDLTNKPSINDVTLSGNKSLSDLGVPTKTSDLTNDSGFITSSDIPSIPDDLNDLSDVNISSPTNGQVLKYNDSTEKWENSSSGGGGTTDYADLSNKPSIENVTLSGNKSASDLGLVKSSDLATVATSGSYNDLSNKPSIPSSASDIGLGNVVNTGDSATPVENGTTKFTTGGAYTELEKKQRKVQYTVMPTASVDFSEIIVQYIGVTGNGYTHGYFYEAVNDNGTYSWVQTNVQPSSGGGGSYTAGDGIDITNDVISTKQSEQGDIDEIIDVYPTAGNLVSIVNAFNRGDLYSTNEKMIGQWIDGKPLYQKTLTGTSTSGSYFIDISDLNIDTPVVINGFCRVGNNGNYILNGNSYNTNADKLQYYIAADKAKLYMDSGSSYIHGDYVLSLQYTKTTDTAISIGSTTEYSTTEKVVGTWIDGKPIWQKTIQSTLPNCATLGTIVTSYVDVGVEVERFINTTGFIDVTGAATINKTSMPINVSNGTSFTVIRGVPNDGNTNYKNKIEIGNATKVWNGAPVYITIQYIKVTT